MLDLGVLVDDRRRVWRFATTDAQAQANAADGPGGPGHDYMYVQADLGLDLDPRLLHEVSALLSRRLEAKRAYRWDQADALQVA